MKNSSFIFFIFFLCHHCFSQYGLTRLPSPINTDEFNEICPVMSFDEKTLFFTRAGSPNFERTLIENRQDLSTKLNDRAYLRKLSQVYSIIAGEYVSNPVTSDFNQDIWMATLGQSMRVYHPVFPLNNAFPNSICSNYSHHNEYVVINEFPIDGGVKAGFSYVKRKKDGTFTIPIPIEIHKFKEKGEAVNLSMSNDGQQVFIAMDSPQGHGDLDIYLSVKALNNLYAEPILLGTSINSPYREATPFISQDKNRLYFASNRPGGYGGMDIYYCERLDYTYLNWGEPKLLGQPINSASDDSYPYVFLDENTIMFSSDREGSSDIYSAKMYRDDLLDKPIAVNLNIRNQKGELIQGGIYWQDAYTGKRQGFFRTNTGQYRYIIDDNIPMIFYSRNRSTYSEKPMVDPQILKNKGIHEITLDLVLYDKFLDILDQEEVSEDNASSDYSTEDESIEDLLPMNSNRTIILKNIYFQQSKPEVLQISYPALRQLAEVLKKRPHVQIRIEGHTDNVGNKKDNMELSWARAKAIKEFLVQEGVMEENILTVGYGDTHPLTNNATEEARKKNRRVEIRVMEQ